MKKLLVALILAVILTATLATPAFAGDGQGNMPGKAGDLENPHHGWIVGLRGALYGLCCGYYNSNNWNAQSIIHNWWAFTVIQGDIMNGYPPAKPYWAGKP